MPPSDVTMGFLDPSKDMQLLAWLATVVTAVIGIRVFYQANQWKKADAAKDFVSSMHDNVYAARAIETLDWFYSIRVNDNKEDAINKNNCNESDKELTRLIVDLEEVIKILDRATRLGADQFTKKSAIGISGAEVVNNSDEDRNLRGFISALTAPEYDSLLAFDWFFYYIDRMEQNIRGKLFDFENVRFVFIPYYLRITQTPARKQKFDDFAKSRQYKLSRYFWERYNELDLDEVAKLNSLNYSSYLRRKATKAIDCFSSLFS
jgi:hypothetical protein